MRVKKTLFFLYACFFSIIGIAQDTQAPIIFIYDGSGSMWGQLEGKTKKEIAATTLSATLQKLSTDQKIGLVAYGHRRKSDCADIEFLVDIQNKDKGQISKLVKGIVPTGKTPLAASALQTFEKLKNSGSSATVILITDGIESCGGDLCAVVKKAKEEGIDFRLHIIGFGLKDTETEALKCAAEAGDGEYFDANNTDGLTQGLEEATQAPVEDLEKNFALWAEKNGQPIDAMCKIMDKSKNAWVKSLRTYRDTGFIALSPGLYDLKIRPLENSDVEEVTVSNVRIEEGKMTRRNVSFDAGFIQVNTLNNKEGWDAVVNIYSEASGKIVSGGRTYGRAKKYELIPGKYKVVLKAMQIKGTSAEHTIEHVEVKAKSTTPIEHRFQSGTLTLGAKSGTDLVDATVNIADAATNRSVSGGRTYTSSRTNPKSYPLSPGTYKVTLKALGPYKGQSQSFVLTVKAGEDVKKIGEFAKQ